MFDGAVQSVGSILEPAISAIPNVFIEAFTSIYTRLTDAFSVDLPAAVTTLKENSALLSVASPQINGQITPEDAKDYLEPYADSGFWDFVQVEVTMLIAEAVSLGQVDITLAEFMRNPAVSAYASLIEEIMLTEHRSGMIPAYQYYYLNKYQPLIPPLQDIIRMVVREAWRPEMYVKAPERFAYYMGYLGYTKEWADRYWIAHFLPIELRQAYDNLWRGLWDKERFMYALHIADIHPMWREDIYNVAFRPPGVRELGYGYDVGAYGWDDIKKYRRMAGQSEADAEKSATAMVAYRTEAEREALRREAIYDFSEGLDTEETLRAKLTAIGGRPEIIDLWVARAKYRTDRDIAHDLIKIAKDQFVKGYYDVAGLRAELTRIGVTGERMDVLVADYVSGLVERDYTEADARLLLEILRTPMPITDEEIERRKASVTARINRARRRYERLIAGLDERTGLISGEIESLEAEMAEVLDVIDVQIRSIEDELAGITPEVLTKPILEAIARVRRRYERSLFNVNRRETLLKDDIAATERLYAETLDVIDTNIKYVEEELIILGAAP